MLVFLVEDATRPWDQSQELTANPDLIIFVGDRWQVSTQSCLGRLPRSIHYHNNAGINCSMEYLHTVIWRGLCIFNLLLWAICFVHLSPLFLFNSFWISPNCLQKRIILCKVAEWFLNTVRKIQYECATVQSGKVYIDVTYVMVKALVLLEMVTKYFRYM